MRFIAILCGDEAEGRVDVTARRSRFDAEESLIVFEEFESDGRPSLAEVLRWRGKDNLLPSKLLSVRDEDGEH